MNPAPPLGRCEDIECGEYVYEGEQCDKCWTDSDLLQHAACCDRAFILPDGEDPEHAEPCKKCHPDLWRSQCGAKGCVYP